MSIRPSNLPPIQDMPPEGGFRKVDTARIFRPRGPAGWQLWAGTSLMIMYGFYKVGQTNQEKAHNKLEERKVRYALAPLLQAEADTEYLQREQEILEKEKEIMKDVPGWMPGKSPYFTGRWMPRKVDQFDRGLK